MYISLNLSVWLVDVFSPVPLYDFHLHCASKDVGRLLSPHAVSIIAAPTFQPEQSIHQPDKVDMVIKMHDWMYVVWVFLSSEWGISTQLTYMLSGLTQSSLFNQIQSIYCKIQQIMNANETASNK